MRMFPRVNPVSITSVVALALTITLFMIARSTQRRLLDASLYRLALYQQRAAELPLLEERLRAAKSHLATIPGPIIAANASLAEAVQQNLVRELVQQQHGEVRSAQVNPPIATHGFQKISVQYDVLIQMSHLPDLIYALESHTPYLFIDAADISGPNQYTRQATNPQLEIRWTISAFRQVPS